MSYWWIFFLTVFFVLFVQYSTKFAFGRKGVRLYVWGAILGYGLLRLLYHVAWDGVGVRIKAYVEILAHGKPREPERPRVANNVREIVSVYDLRPLEVCLGFHTHRARKPIKVDLTRHHTLIGSSTGGGKTMLFNSMLIQLFSKGAIFTDVAQVYLVDLKSDNEYDYLNMWAPLLAGYATTIEEALDMLRNLIAYMEGGRHGRKHVLLFIDEVAMLTDLLEPEQKREAVAYLGRLAMQFRTWGTIIAAIQYARFDRFPTPIRGQFDRKVCLPVESKDHARTILGLRPEKSQLPWEPGQFLLREPGIQHLVSGKGMLVDLPYEVEETVNAYIETGLDDPRLVLFHDVAAHLQPGADIRGVNTMSQVLDGWSAQDITAAYRNFALAGAFVEPTTSGQGYKLASTYLDALGHVRKYVDAGRWQSAPEPFIASNNGK